VIIDLSFHSISFIGHLTSQLQLGIVIEGKKDKNNENQGVKNKKIKLKNSYHRNLSLHFFCYFFLHISQAIL
jgi:hypothetical protein